MAHTPLTTNPTLWRRENPPKHSNRYCSKEEVVSEPRANEITICSGTLTSVGTTTKTMHARDMCFAQSLLKHWSFNLGAMQFLCEATHLAFPQPGYQRDACFASVYRQLSVVQSRYLSHMLTAAAGLHTASTGFGLIRGAQQAYLGLCRSSALKGFGLCCMWRGLVSSLLALCGHVSFLLRLCVRCAVYCY
jgi:hypothetical protein